MNGKEFEGVRKFKYLELTVLAGINMKEVEWGGEEDTMKAELPV